MHVLTQRVLALPRAFRFLDTDCFHVLFADSHEDQDAILREKFDYIFFTGSPRVGHVIMVLGPACMRMYALQSGRVNALPAWPSASMHTCMQEAAAKNLTPMTLELGGKSPVIVDQSAKSALDVAVRRIMWYARLVHSRRWPRTNQPGHICMTRVTRRDRTPCQGQAAKLRPDVHRARLRPGPRVFGRGLYQVGDRVPACLLRRRRQGEQGLRPAHRRQTL